MARLSLTCTGLLFGMLRLVVPVAAQEASDALDTLDIAFTPITINEGLSQGMVQDMVQDPHGFMWFGTKDGLNRYDGYTFHVFRHDPDDSTTVRESTITSLYVDPFGRLWVGTGIGVDLFDHATERFIHVPIVAPMGDQGSIVHICLDVNGDLWVATTNTMVKLTFERPVVAGEALPRFTTTWFGDRASTVKCTHDGKLWGSLGSIGYRIDPRHDGSNVIDTLGRSNDGDPRRALTSLVVIEDTLRGKLYGVYNRGVVAFAPDGTWRPLHYFPEGFGGVQCNTPVMDRSGRIWIPTYKGLFRYDTATDHMSVMTNSDPDLRRMAGTVKCMAMERGGTLWVGSSGYGLLKYDPRIERFNTWHDGSIRSLRPGADGTIIVTRYENFLSVFDLRSRTYTKVMRDLSEVGQRFENVEHHTSDMGAQDPEGAYWLCMTYGPVIRYDAAHQDVRIVEPPPVKGAPSGGFMFPVLVGAGNTLWTGGDSALYRVDRTTLATTAFVYPVLAISNPYAFVATLYEGPDGILWAGTMNGLLRLDPKTSQWKHYANDPNDPRSLAVNVIFSICADPVDPTGVLWIGTSGGGLNRLDTRTGTFTRYTTKEGLPNDVVYGVLTDDSGKLWMSTNKGLSRFDPQTNTFRNFSVGDGLQSDEFNRHAFCKDHDGRLYFGGVSGFNYFDPKELAEDSTPVEVRITGIKLMNKPLVFGDQGSPLAMPAYLSGGMEIPYSMNMVSFSFASMEFSAPELHQYRYMLEGFDPEWIEAGTDNSAIYTNLDPGSYTFRVRGRNRDGIWDERGTAFTLTVLPPWWRTWWFYTLCGFVVIGGTLVYIRSLRKQKEFLEKTVALRTHELSREKDRSEELLKNILPVNVATELKHRGHAEARYFEQVTVLFSDFKEFTRVSEQLSPADLVDELNVCFNAFDRIMEKYGVEKIKTIGDAYMAAGGVPDPSGGMPMAVVLAGLEMQQIMREHQAERRAIGKPIFEMRLGIHTGPVVAGIVGRRKFAYDIWGDTVNIASRMESTGEAGEVNISGATYEQVKDAADLLFTPRGKVNAKGKGELEMYYVRARSIQAIVDAEPEKPETIVAPEMQAVPEERPATGLRDLKVLLAEDNEFNAMVAQGQLENWVPGLKLVHVLDGAEAVKAVKGDHFDVVLMDIQMPEMNGYDATKAIRALPGDKSRIPIIAMSANVMKAEIDRCTEAGMNAFVPKPYKGAELLTAITKALDGQRNGK